METSTQDTERTLTNMERAEPGTNKAGDERHTEPRNNIKRQGSNARNSLEQRDRNTSFTGSERRRLEAISTTCITKVRYTGPAGRRRCSE